MDRKQKIILSITGIILVMLILGRLTYAYFLTQITGNTKDKSISVTTKNLSLTYDDGDGSILSSDTKLIPSSNAINTKTFKVINNGDATDYIVILDNVSVTVAGTTTTTTFKTNDFVYTLACKTKDNSDCSNQITNQTKLPLENNGLLIGNDINENDEHTYTLTLWYLDNGSNQSDDMNKSLNARINIEDIGRINPYSSNTNSLAYNIINNSLLETNGTQLLAYPPTKVAKEFSSDNLSSATTIYTYYNPTMYSNSYDGIQDCTDGLRLPNETIYDCSNVKKIEDNPKCEDYEGGFIYDKYDGGPISFEECHNGKPVKSKNQHEKVLSVTQDNYGTSYYFRGNPIDNYVEFNNMCWRIVRIEGDGSVKLVLQKQEECAKDSLCDTEGATIGSGMYSGGDLKDYESRGGMKDAFDTWFNGNLANETPRFSSNIKQKIKSTKVCTGDINTPYDAQGNLLNNAGSEYFYNNHIRIVKNNFASLICNEKSLTTNSYQVYPLTADEVIFAGGKYTGDWNSPINYLNAYVWNSDNFSAIGWWTSSVSYMVNSIWARIFRVGNDTASMDEVTGYENSGYRPAISLIEGIEITEGDGTKSNPYKIKVS